MLKLANYTVTAEIYTGAKTSVYRGYHTVQKYPVIIKSLHPHPEPKKIAQLHHEYQITKGLDLQHIVKIHEIQKTTDSWALICEDIQGESLKRILVEQLLELKTILHIAIQIAQGLSELHKHNITHKDIKPANIIINLETGLVKITDFSISSRTTTENSPPNPPNLLEGTLAYLSPEQTGRMNRTLDHRTDFYSLGIVLYEMTVGHPPFQTYSTMELVHCHIAKQPIPPHKLNPKIPVAVSEIIMQLLEKTAEARYQSGFGIKTDLQTCLNQLQTNGQIEIFAYKQWDIPEKLQISQKLYGRDREISTLLQTVERASYGTAEMIFITGDAGMGKTALIQEIYKPITRKHAYFIVGKFQQLQNNIPYSAIVSAFTQLTRQLLTENEQQLAHWRKKLITALGNNGQIVIDIIPEIAHIIGVQPPLQTLENTETQNRFKHTLQNFIRVFCNPKHPLILFLDDLQWSDIASLKLIELMMTDKETRGLLLIGTYRNNEITAEHPLLTTLQILRKERVAVKQINLTPLTLESTRQLLIDTLRHQEQTVQPLAELLNRKTAGNPFFINQFLKALHEENLLKFNTDQHSWQWDIQQIQVINMTDNVIELMSRKIKKLPLDTQHLLQQAACIGQHFDLNILTTLHKKTTEATRQDLDIAMQAGLIVSNTQDPNNYKFLHHRVQQTAYALMGKKQKKATHLQIGEILLTNTPQSVQTEKFFEIIDHLNLGKERLTGIRDKIELAELNLAAAKKAKNTMAYNTTMNYLTTGITLLSVTCWQSDYALTQELYVTAAETAYLNTEFEQATELTTIALKYAKTLLEQIKIYEIIIQNHIAQEQLQAAVHTSLEILRRLGITLASQPPENINIQDCYHLPEMKDPEKLAAMRILNTAISPAYTVKPELIPSIAYTMIQLSVEYGNSALSAYSYSMYGLILCVMLQDVENGYQAGQLAQYLLEKFPEKKLKAKILTANNVTIMPWKQHAQTTLVPLTEAIRSGLEIGDMEYACLAAMHSASYRFWVGEPLEVVLQRQNEYLAIISKVKQKYQRIYVEIWRQTVLNLMDKQAEHGYFKGEVFEGETLLTTLLESNYGMAVYAVYLVKLYLYYLCGDYEQAVQNAQLAEPYEAANAGIMIVGLHKFYYTLALLAHYTEVGTVRQQVYLHHIEQNQLQLEKWATHAPMNYQHRCQLIAAEKARVLQQPLQAMAYYDQAIQNAKINGYLPEEALANELAAQFWLGRDKTEFAYLYLEKAYYGYQLWGAKRKVKDLEKQYPQLMEKPCFPEDIHNTITHTTVYTPEGSEELDVAAIARASQTLSEEIILEALVQKMLKIVIETAGAQKGLLILQEEGQYYLKAESQANQIAQYEAYTLEESACATQLPITLINYVIRTGKDTLLNDVTHDDLFSKDPYIQLNQPKSLFGIPIKSHGQIMGVLYLENNLTANAFTTKHLVVLKTLTGQIAISLRNALLYQQNTKACQEAEATSRVKSTFLATMSHELRTPLNGILGYAQILSHDKQLTPKQRENINVIQRSGNYLLTLINDILDLSKIETGRMELYQVDFMLQNFLDNLIEPFKIRAKQKGLLFIYKLMTELPIGVFGDEKRLRQIIVNLLSNAIKFTRKGHVTCKVSYKNEKLRLHVEDTGIGIAPEMIGKIFLPFQQATGDSYTEKAEGTGVGLYIAKTLVEKMGGELRVESTPGQGSTFWTELTLPKTTVFLNTVTQTEQEIIGYQRQQEELQHVPVKVLVIDDEQDNRAILADLLTPLGFTVIEAADGQQGLEKAHTYRPDIILIDFVMPVLDGFTTIRLLRNTPEFKTLIIVGCSGSLFTYEQRELCHFGCDAFIPKPLHLETLLRLLEEKLNIQWIYKKIDHPPELQKEQLVETLGLLAGPSTEQAVILYDLAMMGDINGILQCIEHIEQTNQQLVPFTQQIRELAKDFAEERICKLVEQYL